jgi:hypothetical protein
MLYYPQLLTGSVAQFPSTKRIVYRTVVNRALDGREIKLMDPDGGSVEWNLQYTGLTNAECSAIAALNEATEGRLATFTFLDPFDNLLRWSEDLGAGAWVRDGGLSVTGSVTDPLETARASRITNTTQGAQSIHQYVEAPAGFRYAMSVYARGAGAELTLYASCAGTRTAETFQTGPTWRRIEHSMTVGGSGEGVLFGLEIGGASTAEVYGMQVEAQAHASGYKRTWGRSGVYRNARLLDDALAVTADGVEQNSCTVGIVAIGG